MALIILIFVNFLVHFTTATVLLFPQPIYNGQQANPDQLTPLLVKPVLPLTQAAASLLAALTAPLGAVHRATELASAQAVPASQAVLNAASSLPNAVVKTASPLLTPIAGQLSSLPPITSLVPSASAQLPPLPAPFGGIPNLPTPTLNAQQPAIASPSFPPTVGAQNPPSIGGQTSLNTALPVLPLPSSQPPSNLPVASGVLPSNALLPNLLDLSRTNNPSTQLSGGSAVSTEGITLRP